MKQLQFRFINWVFTPSLVGAIATIIFIPLFIKLGLWQYGKAQQQILVQAAYKQSIVDNALDLPLQLQSYNSLQYKKVKVTGHYESKYQILLDNQVENERVGFHVITPLKIDNTNQFVLIDRGWLLGKDTHTDLPTVDTPSRKLEVVGQVWLPSAKIFTLENNSTPTDKKHVRTWSMVWQNMDMAKYKQSTPIAVLPVVIRLDAASTSGGFVRNWQVPSDRIATNMSYAYQWFGFAFATFAIFLYMSIKKADKPSIDSAIKPFN